MVDVSTYKLRAVSREAVIVTVVAGVIASIISNELSWDGALITHPHHKEPFKILIGGVIPEQLRDETHHLSKVNIPSISQISQICL